MPKKRVYINLVCLFLCILLLFLLGCERKEKAEPENKKMIPGKTTDMAAKPKLAQKDKEFSALLDKLKQKNPFSKSHLNIEKYRFASGGLSLSGIFYDEKRPLAIINDQVLAEGDMLGDKQVIKISRDEVVLKDGEKEYRLKTE